MSFKLKHRRFKLSMMALVVWGVATTGFLYGTQPNNSASAADAAPALPVVEAVTAKYSALRQWRDFSGRLQAVDAAQIRPLVSGTVQKVLFEDGAQVEQGQTLFVIDPRPFEAQLQHARANLASAESELVLAQVEFERADALAGNQAVSKSIRDTRENALHIAKAARESARAQVAQAELDLEYAYVKAPISGRVSRAEVTVGNVVQAGPNAPLLTTIVNLERLYAEFDVDEDTYFRIMGSANNGRSDGERPVAGGVPVEVAIGSGRNVVHQASLHAFDNQLDENSGTIRARAIVENVDRSLIPGVFINVRIGTVDTQPTLLVPERAISVSQSKRFVYVVNADDVVEYREVVLGESLDGQRVILSGVVIGERVIVNGVQRVMSDMQVAVTQI